MILVRTLLFSSPLLAASERSFSHHAAINPWLMLLTFAAAGAMIFYLYRAQQRIASKRMVGALTVLRLLLVLALFVLLLQPGYRWKHTHQSAGTLWVMLDASESMALTDPQATPIERLRWADALDYLPPDMPRLRVGEIAAWIGCLRNDLARLQTASVFGAKDESASSAINRFRDSLRSWQKDLDTAANQLAEGGKSKPALGPVSDSLRKASGLVAGGLEAGSSATTVAGSIKAIEWSKLETELSGVIKSLAPITDEIDQAFLTAHGSEQPVQEALARVAKLSRADLGLLQLTTASRRWPQSLKELFPSYKIRLASFSDKVNPTSPGSASELPEAFKRALSSTGQATSLSNALQLITEQIVPDEPTSVLVLSDGRQNTEGEPDRAAQQLATQGVRVYGIAMGSRQLAVDVSVDDVDAPAWVYKDDKLTARASIRTEGLAGKEVAVEFWRGGKKIDTKKITPKTAAETQSVSFQDEHPEIGVFDYEVRVDGGPAEENKQNNQQDFRVSVRKDQLKLLLVEDQPRWEYRHLVSYLSRDKSVKLQTVLLQPSRINDVTPPPPVKASPRNERPEAQQLPETKEEWSAFDVIILGDVTRESLPNEAQEAIAAAVKNGSKTLIVLAGQRAMPGTYANTPLAEILPVQLSGDWSAEVLSRQLKEGFRISLTAQGAASVLGQFANDPAINADLLAAAPPWYWHSEQTTAKPSASVLLSIIDNEVAATQPSDRTTTNLERRRALLATSSLGLGRVMYLASDQTWRLRQVNGQNLQDRFWGQVLRWAMGNDLPAGGQLVRFGADKRRYNEGDGVVVSARLSHEDLSPLTGQKFELVARLLPQRAAVAGASTLPTSQALHPASSSEPKIVAQTVMNEVPDAPGLYRATVKGLPSGNVELSLRGAEVETLMKDVTDDRFKTVPISIQAILTLEQKNTNADPQKMADITKAGGGAVVDGPYAPVLSRFIPQPKLEEVRYEQLGLFGDQNNYYTKLSHWIFLGVFVTLITAEWIVRKVGGLV